MARPVGPTGGDILTEDRLREAVEAGSSQRDIARAVGCHPQVVAEHLARTGLSATLTRAQQRNLRRWYLRDGLSIEEVAKRAGVGERTARRQLLEAGVQLRLPGRPSGS